MPAKTYTLAEVLAGCERARKRVEPETQAAGKREIKLANKGDRR